MLREVIIVTDCEESIQKALKQVEKARLKGRGVALDYTRIKDSKRKREIIMMFMK